MIRKALVQRLFEAFSIRRWNDQIRPVDFVEMDKHGHKMAIVYCLARWEESLGGEVDWNNLIRGGLYELLRRVVLSDIKSPVYRRIRIEHPDVFARLNDWVFEQLGPHLPDDEIRSEFRDYLRQDDFMDPLSRRLLAAGHVFASFWEFQIIRHSSPPNSQMAELDSLMHADLEPHLEIPGMRKLLCQHPTSRFVDFMGQLRFQVRWSQTPRIPRTSVLGHSLIDESLTGEICAAGTQSEKIRDVGSHGWVHDVQGTGQQTARPGWQAFGD